MARLGMVQPTARMNSTVEKICPRMAEVKSAMASIRSSIRAKQLRGRGLPARR